MITQASDADLGRHLLTLRSLQWIHGSQGDPYALLLRTGEGNVAELHRQIRRGGPLHQSCTGAWVTGSRREAVRILADPRLQPHHPGLNGPQEHVIHNDVWVRPTCHVLPLAEVPLYLSRSDYARLMRLAGPELGDAALASRHTDVVGMCLDHLDRFSEHLDLKAGFAAPTAMHAVGSLLGISHEDRELLAWLAPKLAGTLDAGICPPQLRSARALTSALSKCEQLFQGLIATRANRDSDGAISRMLGPWVTASESSDVLSVCVLTAAVGAEAAANLLCRAVAELLNLPDLWIAVRDDLDLAARVVDEVVRLHPPVRLESLVAQERIEWEGAVIPVDSQVVVLIEAADQDPEVYARADCFDIERDRSDRLSDVGSMYAGLVVPVARWYAVAALQALAARISFPRLAGVPVQRLRSPVTRGLLSMALSIGRPNIRADR